MLHTEMRHRKFIKLDQVSSRVRGRMQDNEREMRFEIGTGGDGPLWFTMAVLSRVRAQRDDTQVINLLCACFPDARCVLDV